MYQGVRYVWGGEGLLGIDCSGLVRKGLVWSQLNLGIAAIAGRRHVLLPHGGRGRDGLARRLRGMDNRALPLQ